MSRLDMYKPQSKLLRNNRSSSPILESKLVNKLSSKSFLQIPKNSLVYYKKLSKKLSSNKKDSPRTKLRETLNSKHPLSSSKQSKSKVLEIPSSLLLPPLKPEEAFSKTDPREIKDRSQVHSSKTTLKLLKKLKITSKSPEVLPKLTQRPMLTKCMVGPSRKKQTKEQSATWSDTGSLSAWETSSIV
jgi:hypothetical protein